MEDGEIGVSEVWRASRPLSTTIWLEILLIIAAGVIVVSGISHLGVLVAIPPGMAFAAMAWALWALALRPKTVADDAGLCIVGAWSSVRLPWVDIVGCQPARAGLIITCRYGRRRLARYPQRPKLAAWLGRSTQADRVAAYILDRADAARRQAFNHSLRPDPGPHPRSPRPGH